MMPAECYIDPDAGSNTTGNGTIGNPFKTLQHAYNNFTPGAAGTRYNIKAGTTDATGNTSLSLAAATASANRYIQGYTSAAGDGGIGSISTGTAAFFAASYNNWHVQDMEITCASINMAQIGHLLNSTIHGNVTSSSGGAMIVACVVNGTINANSSNGGQVRYCRVTHSTGYGITAAAVGTLVDGNVIISQSGSTGGISINNGGCIATRNSLYAPSGATNGILLSTSSGVSAYNNLIEGYTTALKTGTTNNTQSFWANSSFGHTTLLDNQSRPIYQTTAFGNVSLSESPFVNAGSGDFTPKNIANVNSGFSAGSIFRGALSPAAGGGGGAAFQLVGGGGLVY